MLTNNDKPSQEWINLICREWRRNSSPVLAQMIQQGGYMASKPPRLVVMSGHQAGRDDDLLKWVQGMSSNGDESTIQSLNREQLMASLDVFLHHKQWDELIEFCSKMFCTIDMDFWREFVSRVAECDPFILLRIAESCPPKMAQSCLQKIKEIDWRPADEKVKAFLSAVDDLLDDSGQSLYPIPFRTGQNFQKYYSDGSRLSVQDSSLAIDPPLSQKVSVTAAKKFVETGKEQFFNTFWYVGPFSYQSGFNIPKYDDKRFYVYLHELEMGIEGPVISIRWHSKATYNSIVHQWRSGQYSGSLIADLLSRIPPHLVTEKELLSLQQMIPQIMAKEPPRYPQFVLNMIYWSQHRMFSEVKGSSFGGRYKLLNSDAVIENTESNEENEYGI